jgi:malonyl CoA-acyl carrier protein transacylase
MDEPHRGTPLFERGLDLLGYDPFDRIDAGTRTQQPALFLCCAAEWEAWDGDRDDVAAAAGHSLGEYAALYAAGALEFDDAVRLVDARATAMADAARRNPGGMVAMLGGDDHAVRDLAQRLRMTVANDNAPGQLVLSGAMDAVDAAVETARDEIGARARKLDVGGAFHSPLMEPAAAKLAAALKATPVAAPRFPVFANGSAAPFTDVKRELSENLLRPVRFRETLLALRAAGIDRFAELGPGEVLTGLVKRTLRAAEPHSRPEAERLQQIAGLDAPRR